MLNLFYGLTPVLNMKLPPLTEHSSESRRVGTRNFRIQQIVNTLQSGLNWKSALFPNKTV